MESKVVFIGAGNMAEAIVSGMVDAKFCAPEKIILTDIRAERLDELNKKYGVSISTDNQVVKRAEIVVLSVKPQVMNEVLQQMAPFLCEETLVISIAAGVSSAKIESGLDGNYRVIRVMPNTPALIGQGAAALAPGRYADEADVEVAESILNCVGLTVRVTEREIDAVTALSGSGPAYVFYLIEGMLAAAEEMGLEKETARLLTLQTVSGATQLMKESGEEAGDLRAKVTSKGGTTAAAIQSLNDSGVDQAIVKALIAARYRSIELSG